MRTLLVGLGGFAGSILRYWLGSAVQGLAPRSLFPFGTVVVNLAGCLVIGFLAEIAESRGYFGPESRALLFVGLLGGFTTFSAFANETINAFRDGAPLTAGLNVVITVIGCLAAVVVGRSLGALI